MIRRATNGSGHTDGDLCCVACGRRGLWQPSDRDPCADAWWCYDCRTWDDDPLACGPYPRRWFRRDALGRSQLVPACDGYPLAA